MNFESLTLQDPDNNGDCKTEYVQVGQIDILDFFTTCAFDRLQVTGGVSGASLPTLCGTLDNQHMIYTPFSNFPARLSIVTEVTAGMASSTTWRIRVDQYECDSPVLAPEGCLQYYMGIAGNVSSFNWKTDANSADGAASADWPNQISSLK